MSGEESTTAEAVGGGGPDPAYTTVHDAVREVAGAREVFRRFGIDTCCGGELPLAEAASAHGVELEALLDALEAAGAGG